MGGDGGIAAAFHRLMAAQPDHFHMIPRQGQPVLQGPAGLERADRRHVDHEHQLLGLQPVHPAARWPRRTSARRRAITPTPEAADAGHRGAARHRRGDAGAEPGQAGPGLSDDDALSPQRHPRPGVRGTGRGDRGLAGDRR